MKLRNKKTGEIWDIGKVLVNDYPCWETLTQICEDWEDVKEPLIKDKKIRKAVRAWWESIPCEPADKLVFYKKNQDLAVGVYTIYCGAIYPEGTLKEGKKYTIAELCGEEEE